jgi:hypothetical protein
MFAAIDPLAVMLPTKVYLALLEKLHPNEPPTQAIDSVMHTLSARERGEVVASARRVAEYANAVMKAAGAAQ